MKKQNKHLVKLILAVLLWSVVIQIHFILDITK